MQKANLVIIFLEWTGILMLFMTACPQLSGKESHRHTPAVQAVRKTLPWVVSIGTEEIVQVNDPYNLYFNDFFQQYYRRKQLVKRYFPLGSGILVDGEGLVVTNYHVVQRARNIEVRLWNGLSYKGKLVGFDQPNDLCLLQLEKKKTGEQFAAADLSAGDMMLGETVISIGNPYGLEHSVSQGVLSAINRSIDDEEVSFRDILQTDAAINPGNSGGPLINLDGELMGMNLAIRQDAQGIGFAIPVRRIEQFLGIWMLPVHFSQGWLGLETGALLSPGSRGGMVLPDLDPQGSLARSGLKKGDEIVSISGHPVRRYLDFSRIVWKMHPGDEIHVILADRRQLSVKLKLLPPMKMIEFRLGLRVQALTPALSRAMGLPEQIQGLVVSEVIPQKKFAMQRILWRDVLKRGDVVTHFNRKPVRTSAGLAELLKTKRSGQICEMQIISLNYSRMTYNPLVLEIILN